MTDPTTPPTPENPAPAEDPSVREEIRAKLQAWGEELKQSIASRIDQALDEIGARIGGQ